MKVLLVNGSPNERGCTAAALGEVAAALNDAGVETASFWVGKAPLSGCVACRACRTTGSRRCVIDDRVNALIALAETCDGFVFGSPVYYASASGQMTCLLDRAFFAGGAAFSHKAGACVVSARRAGTTATLDQLYRYVTGAQMLAVTSSYWNMVFGNTPDEVRQDAEGMQTMRALGQEMAWVLKCVAAGRERGILPPTPPEVRARTNFIR